jgi:SEL1 protein
MSTLAHINSHPYAHREDTSEHSIGAQGYPTSFWSALLPNIQGQGPIASAMRIALKLRHQTWIPSFLTNFLGKELGGGRRKEEELQSKAVKVLDLLQHAAELGHTDALYALSQLYMVRMLMSTQVLCTETNYLAVAPSQYVLSFRTNLSI